MKAKLRVITVGHHAPEKRRVAARKELLVGGGAVLQREKVGVFDAEPPAGLGRLEHAGEGMLGLREMFEHLSRMYEVEGSMLQRIGGDVVPAHLQVLLRELLKEAGLQVGGNYGAGRCYLLAKPPSDRACSGSNL